jgi:hypothetical protein
MIIFADVVAKQIGVHRKFVEENPVVCLEELK